MTLLLAYVNNRLQLEFSPETEQMALFVTIGNSSTKQ